MDNAYILVSYENYKGGVNNLQIAKIVFPSMYSGLVDVLRVFTSTKSKAFERAQKHLATINK